MPWSRCVLEPPAPGPVRLKTRDLTPSVSPSEAFSRDIALTGASNRPDKMKETVADLKPLTASSRPCASLRSVGAGLTRLLQDLPPPARTRAAENFEARQPWTVGAARLGLAALIVLLLLRRG